MNLSVQPPPQRLRLPSDQDASGRSLGEEELDLLTEAIRSGSLIGQRGTFVKALEQRFAALCGVKYAYACSSGSAAVHTAVASIDLEPGEEIITSPITDMGALTPILYQGGVPVFADVDPRTYNVTAATVERCLSVRTRAIIVTHLFGNSCDMTEIMELARRRHLPVIEDCAQAYLSRHAGRMVATFGAAGCFSLQQGKHITTGEGGLVVSNDDAVARRLFLFINKAWGYGDANPDHYFLALNYRMSELQAAVAVAQLEKLPGLVATRIAAAARLTERLQGVPGIAPPWVDPRNVHTYWKYCLFVDSAVIPGGPGALAMQLREIGIASAPRYIQKPAFACEIFQKQNTLGSSRFPFSLARPEAVDYDPRRFPGVYQALEGVLVLPLNERYTEEHLDYLADAVREAAERLATGAT